MSWAPPLPHILCSLGRDIGLLSDTLHLLPAGGDPHSVLALRGGGSGPVASSWHGAEPGERSPVTFWASPSTCRVGVQRKGSQQRPSTFTGLFHPPEVHISCGKLLVPVSRHRLLRVQPNFIITRQQLPFSCQKGCGVEVTSAI